MPKPDLENAYALNSLEDTRRLYADWAETYDQSFVEASDFVLPQRVAAAFVAAGGVGPVLDFGCGTGVVGQHLAALGAGPADGADLSPEMLAVAARKGVYRDLIEGNVLDGLTVADGTYAGVVSSGTFTHGHVGPVCLPELMRIARPGALFVLTINAQVFDQAGFGSAFAELVAENAITPIRFRRVRYYEGAEHDHAGDTGLAAVFRRTG